MWPNRVGRCGVGGVKGHIKAFEKVKQGAAPCKIDAGGNTATYGALTCLEHVALSTSFGTKEKLVSMNGYHGNIL